MSQCTDLQSTYSFGDFCRLRMMTSILAFATVCLVAPWVSDSRTTVWAIIAVGLTKCVEAASDLCGGRLQKHERLPAVATSLSLRGIAAIAAVGLVYPATGSLPLGLASIALGWIVVLVCYDLPAVAKVTPVKGAESPRGAEANARVLSLARLTLPLGVAAGVCALEVNAPRYIVQRTFGEYELGVLGVMTYLTLTGQLVIAALGQAAIPRLATLYGSQQFAAFRRVLYQLCSVSLLSGLLLVVGAMVVGRLVLYYLFGPAYASWNGLFVVISLAATLQFVAAMLSVTLRSMSEYRWALVTAPRVPRQCRAGLFDAHSSSGSDGRRMRDVGFVGCELGNLCRPRVLQAEKPIRRACREAALDETSHHPSRERLTPCRESSFRETITAGSSE